MKKMFFLIISFVFLPIFCMNWFRGKKAQPATEQTQSGVVHAQAALQDNRVVQIEINKLINENQRLKQENISLQKENDEKIVALEKQVEHLGRSFFNTLKTFEANINSKDFSNSLEKLKTRLDSKDGARLINEAIANALYRLKFMYTETRYLLEWTNKNFNWKAAESKGIKPPVLKNNFSDDQIKKMVMAVEVK